MLISVADLEKILGGQARGQSFYEIVRTFTRSIKLRISLTPNHAITHTFN